MPDRDTHTPSYPTVELVLGAIADWVNKYRNALGHRDELEQCGPDEVNRIARDLGVPLGEFQDMASKRPDSALLLGKMLRALNVDPKEILKTEPAVMRDLQRLCVNCGDKTRCRHELAAGTAAAHFHEFCPNAYTLDALFEEKAAAKH